MRSIKTSLLLMAITASLVVSACATTPKKSLYGDVARARSLSEFERIYASKQRQIPKELMRAWYYIISQYDHEQAERILASLSSNERIKSSPNLGRLLATASLFAKFDTGDLYGIFQQAKRIVELQPNSLHAQFALGMMRFYVLPKISSTHWDEIDKWAQTIADKAERGIIPSSPEFLAALLKIRTTIATKMDDSVTVLEQNQRQGLVLSWLASSTFGRFPFYDLSAIKTDVESPRPIQKSYQINGETVNFVQTNTLRNPVVDINSIFSKQGVTYKATFFELAKDSNVTIRISGEAEAYLFVDSKRILHHNAVAQFDHDISYATVKLPAGKHRLLIKQAYTTDADRLDIYLTTTSGTAIPTFASFENQPNQIDPDAVEVVEIDAGARKVRETMARNSDDPILLLEAAIVLSSDYGKNHLSRHTMEQAMQVAPNWAGLRALLAHAYNADKSIPNNYYNSFAREQLEAAYEISGGKEFWALIDRFRKYASNNDRSEALAVLEKIRTIHKEDPFLLRLELSLYNSDLWADKRQRTIKRLYELDPKNPDVILQMMAEHERYYQYQQADEMFWKYLEVSKERMSVVGRLIERGELDKATKVIEKQLRIFPADINLRQQQVSLYITMGQFDKAREALKWFQKLPGSERYIQKTKRIIASFSMDDEQYKKFLLSLIAKNRQNTSLRKRLMQFLGQEEFAADATDAFELIADYQNNSNYSEFGMVNVLDEYIVEFLPQGGKVERIHTIYHLLSQSAVEQMTEMKPPSDVIYQMRAITPGGEVVYPHAVPGKDTVAYPRLSVGDFLELDYAIYTPKPKRLPEYADTRFYFLSAYQPTYRSHVVVFAPKARKIGISWQEMDAELFGNGEPSTAQANGYVRYEWKYDQLPAYTPEPYMPPTFEVIPNMHVYYPMDWQDVVAYTWDKYRAAFRQTYPMRKFLKEAIGTTTITNQQQIRQLYRKVCNYIQRGGALDYYPFYSIYTREGGRLLLFKTLLDIAGVESHLVELMPSLYRPANLESELFQYITDTLLAVRVDKDSFIYFDGASRFSLPGVYRLSLTGAKGVLVEPPGSKPRFINLPQPEVLPQKGRESRLELWVDASGAIRGKGIDSVFGYTSRSYRKLLGAQTPEKQKDTIEHALNVTGFRGARLTELSIENTKDPTKPLLIKYGFEVAHFAKRTKEGLRLDAPFFLSQLGKRFIRTTVRTFPMLIDTPFVSNDTVILHPPAGFRLVRGPLGKRELKEKFGTFSFELENGPDGTIVMKRSLFIPPQRIEPADYASFMVFCSQADRIEAQSWVLSPNSDKYPSTASQATPRHTMESSIGR